MSGEHPGEIDAPVDRVGQAGDLAVRGEALADGQDTGDEQRRIDRRQLAVPFPRAGTDVDEVKEPPALVRHPRGEEAQRCPGTLDGRRPRYPAAIGGNAETAETETDRRDTADVARVGVHRRASGTRAIADDA